MDGHLQIMRSYFASAAVTQLTYFKKAQQQLESCACNPRFAHKRSSEFFSEVRKTKKTERATVLRK